LALPDVIFTVPANKALADIHERMPAILSCEAEDTWLDANVKDNATLLKILQPYPDEGVDYYPVSTLVNSAKIDSAECIQPA
jgi:putative SOS response-associated peptidase YedK